MKENATDQPIEIDLGEWKEIAEPFKENIDESIELLDLSDLKEIGKTFAYRSSPNDLQRIILTISVIGILAAIVIFPMFFVGDWTTASKYLDKVFPPIIGIVGTVIGYFFASKSKT